MRFSVPCSPLGAIRGSSKSALGSGVVVDPALAPRVFLRLFSCLREGLPVEAEKIGVGLQKASGVDRVG